MSSYYDQDGHLWAEDGHYEDMTGIRVGDLVEVDPSPKYRDRFPSLARRLKGMWGTVIAVPGDKDPFVSIFDDSFDIEEDGYEGFPKVDQYVIRMSEEYLTPEEAGEFPADIFWGSRDEVVP